MGLEGFKLALLQLKIFATSAINLISASEAIYVAAQKGANVIALPEGFATPSGISNFADNSETIPNGPICTALSNAAKKNKVYIIGGTLPERSPDNRLYNTCTIWSPDGELLGAHRKIHLDDVQVPGEVTRLESAYLTGGQSLTTFMIDNKCRAGVGICYDVRFVELAQLYRRLGCHILFYPGQFNMNAGPLHWELLHRARAVDTQMFVVAISPARDHAAYNMAYGHSMIIDPWGRIMASAKEYPEIILCDIDLNNVEDFRSFVPIFRQRRTDVYDTVFKTVGGFTI